MRFDWTQIFMGLSWDKSSLYNGILDLGYNLQQAIDGKKHDKIK